MKALIFGGILLVCCGTLTLIRDLSGDSTRVETRKVYVQVTAPPKVIVHTKTKTLTVHEPLPASCVDLVAQLEAVVSNSNQVSIESDKLRDLVTAYDTASLHGDHNKMVKIQYEINSEIGLIETLANHSTGSQTDAAELSRRCANDSK